METVQIFSYGSNMSSNRIEERIGKVKFIQFIKLYGYELVFNKKSKDGSSKANIRDLGENHIDGPYVYGAIYEMTLEQRKKLDKFEGLGYGYDLYPIIEDKINVYSYIAKDEKYLVENLGIHT